MNGSHIMANKGPFVIQSHASKSAPLPASTIRRDLRGIAPGVFPEKIIYAAHIIHDVRTTPSMMPEATAISVQQ